MRLTIFLIALVIAMYAPITQGVKLYKWVDEEGNVTYQDTPPPRDLGGEVQQKHINPDDGVTEFVVPEPSADQAPAETSGYGAPGGSTKSSRGLSTAEKGAIVTGNRPLLRERHSGVAPTPPPRPAPARPSRPARPSPPAGAPRVPTLPPMAR